MGMMTRRNGWRGRPTRIEGHDPFCILLCLAVLGFCLPALLGLLNSYLLSVLLGVLLLALYLAAAIHITTLRNRP